MNTRDYYLNLIDRLRELEVAIPDCLNLSEHQAVSRRISLIRSQAGVLLASLNRDDH